MALLYFFHIVPICKVISKLTIEFKLSFNIEDAMARPSQAFRGQFAIKIF